MILPKSKYFFRFLKNIFLKSYSTELYPYTTKLYKKNFIKYESQSKQAVTHDYVFHADERLPSLEKRLNGWYLKKLKKKLFKKKIFLCILFKNLLIP